MLSCMSLSCLHLQTHRRSSFGPIPHIIWPWIPRGRLSLLTTRVFVSLIMLDSNAHLPTVILHKLCTWSGLLLMTEVGESIFDPISESELTHLSHMLSKEWLKWKTFLRTQYIYKYSLTSPTAHSCILILILFLILKKLYNCLPAVPLAFLFTLFKLSVTVVTALKFCLKLKQRMGANKAITGKVGLVGKGRYSSPSPF